MNISSHRLLFPSSLTLGPRPRTGRDLTTVFRGARRDITGTARGRLWGHSRYRARGAVTQLATCLEEIKRDEARVLAVQGCSERLRSPSPRETAGDPSSSSPGPSCHCHSPSRAPDTGPRPLAMPGPGLGSCRPLPLTRPWRCRVQQPGAKVDAGSRPEVEGFPGDRERSQSKSCSSGRKAVLRKYAVKHCAASRTQPAHVGTCPLQSPSPVTVPWLLAFRRGASLSPGQGCCSCTALSPRTS